LERHVFVENRGELAKSAALKYRCQKATMMIIFTTQS
jgi:hypothetical protein